MLLPLGGPPNRWGVRPCDWVGGVPWLGSQAPPILPEDPASLCQTFPPHLFLSKSGQELLAWGP